MEKQDKLQEELRVIKIPAQIDCPHCKKDFFVCVKSYAPTIVWALKKADINKAKSELLKELTPERFKSTEEFKAVIDWVNNPETLFGPEEVDVLRDQILENQKK